ncbi:MAG: type III pantothenate kinase [Bacilli bacterium]|jgi:type III pantothenate kinase|nr:type III pantothenate kinase [Bacilli bacterium]MDY0064220.1 type III pantothenate kinase [Bacilli bacterium]
MLICVDVGNSNIVVGVFNDQNQLLPPFRLETKVLRTEDEYGIRFLENLQFLNVKASDITGAIIASVVPTVDANLEKTFLKYFQIKPLFIAPGVKSGIKITIDNPKQLGADLLVGAVGATSKYGYPCLVVDMGTAITLMVVNERKEIIGGIIYPGIYTAYNGLIRSTSLLESTKIGVPSHVIGKDTVSSIQSGMIFGTAGAIQGMIDKVFEEQGKMKVVITGGTASYIYPYLKNVIYDEHLLMDGLRIVYEKNRSKD